MLQGYKNGWLEQNGQCFGLNFGSDFTAEHEWGIKDLLDLCQVKEDEKVFGIEKRRIKPEKNLKSGTDTKGNRYLLIQEEWYHQYKGWEEYNFSDKENLYTAWDSRVV